MEAIEYNNTTDFGASLVASQAAIGYAIYIEDMNLAEGVLNRYKEANGGDISEIEDLARVVSFYAMNQNLSRPLNLEELDDFGELVSGQYLPYSTSILEWGFGSSIVRSYPKDTPSIFEGRSAHTKVLNESISTGMDVKGIEAWSSRKDGAFLYEISDISGRPVKSVKVTNGMQQTDLIGLSRGVYIVVASAPGCVSCSVDSRILIIK